MASKSFLSSSAKAIQTGAKKGELLGGALTIIDNTPFPKISTIIEADTRLVLINPDRSEEHSVAKFIPAPYHGTWRLKHYLERKHSQPTVVIDFAVHHRNEVLRLLKLHQPPVIGIAFFYDTLEQDMLNIWTVRQLCPDSLIISGGIEATARAEEYIRKLPIDGLLKGEGEFALAELLSRIPEKMTAAARDDLIEQCRDIKGWYWKKSDGSIIKTGPAHPMNAKEYSEVFATYNINVVDYEPYWRFINENYDEVLLEILDLSPKMIRLITANYCPYGCSFCISTSFLKLAAEEKKVLVVGATAEELVEKVENILAVDPSIFIYFDDENFMAMPQRAKDFCNLIIERGVRGKFGCRATAQMITDDICALLSRAGFVVVAFGAESWDDATLKDFNKRLENERSDVAIRNIQRNNMKCSFNVILFAPMITRAGLIRTCDKVLEYVGKECNVGLTTYIAPYPGTLYFDNPDYVIIDGELTVPGTGETVSFPQAVLPNDPDMRAAADVAQEEGRRVLLEWQKFYQWRHRIMPREVSVLALVYGVYVALGIVDENDRGAELREVVRRILGNERHRFVRDDDASFVRNSLMEEQPELLAVENPY